MTNYEKVILNDLLDRYERSKSFTGDNKVNQQFTVKLAKLFPKYDAGVFCEGDTTMVVSRGLGSHTMPIRIGNRPQLITIRFVQEGQE